MFSSIRRLQARHYKQIATEFIGFPLLFLVGGYLLNIHTMDKDLYKYINKCVIFVSASNHPPT